MRSLALLLLKAAMRSLKAQHFSLWQQSRNTRWAERCNRPSAVPQSSRGRFFGKHRLTSKIVAKAVAVAVVPVAVTKRSARNSDSHNSRSHSRPTAASVTYSKKEMTLISTPVDWSSISCQLSLPPTIQLAANYEPFHNELSVRLLRS